MANALEHFEDAFPLMIDREIAFIRKAHPDWYGSLSAEMGGLAIAFFGIENGKPVMAFVNYQKEDRADGVFSIKIEDQGVFGQCPDGHNVCGELLGKKAKGMAYLSAHKGWGGGDLTETVKKIVILEIEEAPDFVSEPISVLRIGQSGTFWIAQNNCPDIKQQPKPKPKREKSSGKRH